MSLYVGAVCSFLCVCHGFLLEPDVISCSDAPTINCTHFANVNNGHICHPVTMATRVYCPLHCGLCTPATTPLPTATIPVTTEVTTPDIPIPQCVDNLLIDCDQMNITNSICNPVTIVTRRYCPFFCNLCTPATTTTIILAPCRDSEFVDCAGLERVQHICSAPGHITATNLCPNYCGLCPT